MTRKVVPEKVRKYDSRDKFAAARAANMRKPCSVEGCTNKRMNGAQPLCMVHFARLQRCGHPTRSNIARKSIAPYRAIVWTFFKSDPTHPALLGAIAMLRRMCREFELGELPATRRLFADENGEAEKFVAHVVAAILLLKDHGLLNEADRYSHTQIGRAAASYAPLRYFVEPVTGRRYGIRPSLGAVHREGAALLTRLKPLADSIDHAISLTRQSRRDLFEPWDPAKLPVEFTDFDLADLLIDMRSPRVNRQTMKSPWQSKTDRQNVRKVSAEFIEETKMAADTEAARVREALARLRNQPTNEDKT